ncbi:hypothetical protein BD289DRAFT_189089 [Coniella lustricola]|uniref:Uncharacterized protein n=1 Tax=Coniella lustricola TaxID=2025994 RepID=A0A2T3ACW5_9PEZI|nr:hypothetical protein BD289DRAFT_189089 [Coniella lustricola]
MTGMAAGSGFFPSSFVSFGAKICCCHDRAVLCSPTMLGEMPARRLGISDCNTLIGHGLAQTRGSELTFLCVVHAATEKVAQREGLGLLGFLAARRQTAADPRHLDSALSALPLSRCSPTCGSTSALTQYGTYSTPRIHRVVPRSAHLLGDTDRARARAATKLPLRSFASGVSYGWIRPTIAIAQGMVEVGRPRFVKTS